MALSLLPNGASSINDFSHHIEFAIERAWVYASLTKGDSRIRGGWLVAAMLQTTELRSVLFGISATFQRIPFAQFFDDLPSIVVASNEASEKAYDGSDLQAAVPGEASGAIGAPLEEGALAKYCSDLTVLAREGGIDPVIGREHEIRTMVDILLRRRQNNPLLTGEAGVGKTAVVEGLAIAIAQRTIPPSLHDVRLLSLDVGALLAGASMRGEFESRLKAVLKEATESSRPVVLFVDEVHTLVGAGGQAGTGDAANLLKPALARGNLRTIGATTWSEYKRHIEKDPALTRRFQVLQVMEPEEASAIAMVRGLASTFSTHHGVVILDEAVRAAVTLSHRYIPSRQLPDKAISLLDTACARVAMSLHTRPPQIEELHQQFAALEAEATSLREEAFLGKNRDAALQDVDRRVEATQSLLQEKEAKWSVEREMGAQVLTLREALSVPQSPEVDVDLAVVRQQLQMAEAALVHHQGDSPQVCVQVDESVVAAIVADWTGIPVGRMVRNELQAVLSLQTQLQKRVIGQDAALAQIADRVKTARAKLSDPGKPLGTFLLVGPSGVGKTETALALAEAIYGGEHNLITINMSEYQESHTVSSLKGAPPGYVGYGEGGVLTEAVRRRPYSVILLDEIEKAHPDVHELFYQVFDKGWMEDGEGRTIDFKNTLILLTSNTGSEVLTQLCDDPALIPEPGVLTDALQPELSRVFPLAFLGRLNVVPYLPLASEVLESIVSLQLEKVVRRMAAQHGIALRYTSLTTQHIVRQCGTHETGARRIAQFIEQNVLTQLAHLWLQSMQDKVVVKEVVLDVVDSEASVQLPVNLQQSGKGGIYLHVRLDAELQSESTCESNANSSLSFAIA
ncbi:protein ClpV1 [Comamonadaceae bacterium OS-1]|nr:protein ClpV1 [Comamonadaceae bacterium OS-1]